MIPGPARVLLNAAMVVAVTLIIATAALVWRVSQSPWPVPFLAPALADALADPASGRRVELGDAVLIWDRERQTLVFELHDLRSIDRAGQVVGAASVVIVRISTPQLLTGQVRVREIAVIRPDLTVLRDADGLISLNVGTSDRAAVAPQPADKDPVIAWLFDRGEAGPLSALRRVRIVGGQIAFDDRKTMTRWDLPALSIEIERRGDGSTVAGTIETAIDGEMLSVAAEVTHQPDDGRLIGRLSVDGLRPASLARHLPDLAEGAALDLPLDADLSFTLAPDGVLADFKGDLTGSAGRLVHAKLSQGEIAISSLSGAVSFVASTADGPGHIEVNGLRLAVADGPTIGLDVLATDPFGRTVLDGKVTLDHLVIDALGRYWPADIGVNPRAWLTENVSQGKLRDLSVAFELARVDAQSPLEPLRIDGQLAIDQARVSYFGRLPAVEQVGGTVRFDASRFDIAVKTGHVQGLVVESGTIVITGLEGQDHRIAIDVAVNGPVAGALTILDTPPLGYIKRFDMKPKAIGGSAAVRLALRFPLLKNLKTEQLDIRADAILSKLSAPAVVRDWDLTDGEFTLAVGNDHLVMSGQGRLHGEPAAISWTENFPDEVSFRRRFEINAVTDQVAIARFGLDLDGLVDGPLAGTIDYTEHDARSASLRGFFDARDAVVKWDMIRWAKPAGTPGTIEFDIDLQNGTFATLRDASFEGGGMSAQVSGPMRPNGMPKRVDIGRMVFGKTDVIGQFGIRDGGGYDITLTGKALDLEPWVRPPPKNPPETPDPDGDPDAGIDPPMPIALSVNVPVVHLGADRTLAQMRLVADHRGEHWRTITLDAQVDGKSSLALRLEPADDHRALTLTADNAGAMLSAFDLTDYVLGGRLSLNGRLENAQRRMTAKVSMLDYRLVRAPILANLLAVASITGIPELLTGDGIAFNSMNADIIRTRRSMDIVEARASGLALGLTAEGSVARMTKMLDLSGTIVPINGLNRAINAIPIIGNLLTGGEGNGLFAWTYSVKGAVDNPDISVNPLSALAPSVVRKLFDFLDPATPKTRTDAEIAQ